MVGGKKEKLLSTTQYVMTREASHTTTNYNFIKLLALNHVEEKKHFSSIPITEHYRFQLRFMDLYHDIQIRKHEFVAVSNIWYKNGLPWQTTAQSFPSVAPTNKTDESDDKDW